MGNASAVCLWSNFNFHPRSGAIRAGLRVTPHPKVANRFVFDDLNDLLHTAMHTIFVNVPEHCRDEQGASRCASRGHGDVELEAVLADPDV